MQLSPSNFRSLPFFNRNTLMLRFIAIFLAAVSGLPFSHAQHTFDASDACRAGRLNMSPPQAADIRSDSFDILHTNIKLDLTGAPILAADAVLSVRLLEDVSGPLKLDLLGWTIDSVSLNGQFITFSYNNPSLNIDLPSGISAGDTIQVRVVYRGTPGLDASGWGGVYQQSGYIYNLGVGFAADPHSYGRAWFPCFDNFVERCAMDLYVTAPANQKSFGNGALMSEVIQPSGHRLSHWRLKDPIPSYLACFSSGPYVSFERSYPSENGIVPVQIAVAAVDTNKLKTSFTHLPEALATFEHWFGPYLWDKIGFSIVPFNAGAMEHATNIAYMRAAVDGTLGFETLMAHELSHHWWGNLMTCSTAEDMWLNEGWASYCEHLFLENVYGQQDYIDAVTDNFLDVLQNSHINEGGYRVVSDIPHEHTYGTHVYNKGAVVAHNLRAYLGDSLFREGLRAVFAENQFDDWSSADLRDALSGATGYPLDDFFADWVFQPGFTDFDIDSVEVSETGNLYDITVFVKQKLRGAHSFYHNVPVEIAFVDSLLQRTHVNFMVAGENSTVSTTLPFYPRHAWLNTQGMGITQARAQSEKWLPADGNVVFGKTRFNLLVNDLSDSMLMRVEHHWAMPDTSFAANPGQFKITQRYWVIDGDFDPAQDLTGSLFYDGRGQFDQLDAALFAQTSPNEDSVVLLYRSGAGHAWQAHSPYTKNTLGSANDRYGLIRFENVLPGQYTLAKGATISSAPESIGTVLVLVVSPNPAKDKVLCTAPFVMHQLMLVDAAGLTVYALNLDGTTSFNLPLNQLPAGTYHLIAFGDKAVASAALVIQP